MIPFETVTVLVSVGALAVAIWQLLRPSRNLTDLGRRGNFWFDHRDDLPLNELPSEDERDAPIPHRPLRGRPR